jgi:glucose/arabinose dehydrogenase
MKLLQASVVAAAIAGTFALPARAQFTYPGCDNLASSNFQFTELFNRTGTPAANVTNPTGTEPVQMAIQGVWSGDSILYTNVYWVERKGKVKFYDGLAKTIDSVGYIATWAGQSGAGNQNDNGLMGIVLDPNFNTNKQIYFWYSPTLASSTQNRRMRLSRITLNSGNKLDMSTEKILLDIFGSKTDQWHSGGPMTFDAYGDLWIAVGNNSQDVTAGGGQYSTTDSSASAEWGSSNTASLRGGVLRIHPDNSARGYSIPSGNFGEYWANVFQGQGKTALAARYRDTTKVRPEIYVKGTRSNYSIAVHPTKRWLLWGEVNYNTVSDEFNIVGAPAFTGFPYFHANNQALPRPSSVVAKDVAAPTNLNPMNSGVDTLPPATKPVYWYGTAMTDTTITNSNVAIGGPLYLYDPALKSAVKFPPHLDKRWFMTSYLSNQMWISGAIDTATLKPAGAATRADNGILPQTWRNPIDMLFGPDGALYMLTYGTGSNYAQGNFNVTRMAYTGTCRPGPTALQAAAPSEGVLKVSFLGDRITVREAGSHVISLISMDGKAVYRNTGVFGAEYSFSALRAESGVRAGVYLLQVKTARGSYVRHISLL